MKIAILGAGGVFGNQLAKYCLTQGHEVMGIGRSKRKPERFTLGIDYPYYVGHVTYDAASTSRLIEQEKADVVVNFAAQGEGAASWGSDNWRFYETNCMGLVKLHAMIDCPFVQIGSSEVYGSMSLPATEEAPLNPSSPYAISKAAFDQHLLVMHRVKGSQIKIVRPSNCYGPGQQLHRIIPKTLVSCMAGRKIELHGGGVARKSYLHTDDLSSAIMTVIEKGADGVYNVGPDQPTSIREVVRRCVEIMDGDWNELVVEAPERTGQDSTYWIDSGKLKALGWKQTVYWDAGLEDMRDWVMAYPELKDMPTDFVMRP